MHRRFYSPIGPAAMAEHDLTARLAKSMDRHLVFPLLEWLSAKELYPEEQIQQGKLDLLNKTNMLDYAMEIYTQLNSRDPPQELKERRTEVVQNLRKLQVRAANYSSTMQGSSMCRCDVLTLPPSSLCRLKQTALFSFSVTRAW